MIEIYDDFLPDFGFDKFHILDSLDLIEVASYQDVSPSTLLSSYIIPAWPGSVLNSCFTRLYRNHYDNPTYIHTDTQMGTHTAVLFIQNGLTPKQDAGVSFWTHKTTRLTGLEKNDINFNEYAPIVDRDSLDPEKWNIRERVEYKENRLVIFPSYYFHSKHTYGNIGKTVEEARIVQVCFFNKGQ